MRAAAWAAGEDYQSSPAVQVAARAAVASVCEARAAAARVARARACEARATRAVRRQREGDGGGEGGKGGESGESGGVGGERRRTRAALQYRTALAADTNNSTRRCSERLTDAWCDASELSAASTPRGTPCMKHQTSTLVATLRYRLRLHGSFAMQQERSVDLPVALH